MSNASITTSLLADAFQRTLRDTPARPLIAVPARDRVWTAGDVSASADRIGVALTEGGVPVSALVVAALGNRPAAIATFLACRRHGLPLMPVDVTTPVAEVGHLARRFGAHAVVLADAQRLEGFEEPRPVEEEVTLSVTSAAGSGVGARYDAAVLKLTSGSTGAPRATLTTEEALVVDATRLIEGMEIGPDDVQIAAIPLSHAYGIGNLLLPLLLQGTPVVLRQAFVPQQLPADARRYGARFFPGVPFMFEHFVANPPADGWPRELTRLISAGAPLGQPTVAHFLERFGVKIRAFYGTTETGGITYDSGDGLSPPGYVGRPLPRVRVTLKPDASATLPAGRVFIESDSVIEHYAGELEGATARTDGGFLSGDLGVLDAQGGLRLVGRVSSFVNVSGHKVQPEEVEAALRAHPDVTDARVLGFAAGRRGEELVAVLVCGTQTPSTLNLRRWCADRLAPHKIPRAFVVTSAIPLTERGKTDWPTIRHLVAKNLRTRQDPGIM